MKLNQIFKSKYCWMVMFLSIFLGYFLVIRKLTSFSNFWSILLSVFYIILLAVSNSCLVHHLKDRVKESVKIGASGVFSILGSILGLGAVQLCTVSGTCGMSIFTSFIFSIFPTSIGMLFIKNGVWILLLSNILLLYSIFKMECLKERE